MPRWLRECQDKRQDAQALVDYALILVLLSLAVVAATASIGGATSEYYQNIWNIIDAALP